MSFIFQFGKTIYLNIDSTIYSQELKMTNFGPLSPPPYTALIIIPSEFIFDWKIPLNSIFSEWPKWTWHVFLRGNIFFTVQIIPTFIETSGSWERCWSCMFEMWSKMWGTGPALLEVIYIFIKYNNYVTKSTLR